MTFFIALMLSLNAGIVVRKEGDESVVREVKHTKNKIRKGTALWLQNFVKQLKAGFYLINHNGKYQKINIQSSKNQFLFKNYIKVTDKHLLMNYFEISGTKD